MATYDETVQSFTGAINVPSESGYGELQQIVDVLFLRAKTVDSLQLISQAEISDVDAEVLEVVNLLPSGSYTRQQMADQLNSIITAHGWGSRHGTVA